MHSSDIYSSSANTKGASSLISSADFSVGFGAMAADFCLASSLRRLDTRISYGAGMSGTGTGSQGVQERTSTRTAYVWHGLKATIARWRAYGV